MRLRASFEVPVILFVLTAAAGALIAYDRTTAWGRFWWIAGGLALCVGLAHLPERLPIGGRRGLNALAVFFALLPLGIAVYFLMTNDWSYRMGKLHFLDPTLRFMSLWQPSFAGHRVDSNVVGGLIAGFVPLQVAALRGKPGHTWRFASIRVAALWLSGLSLVLSESRGAWLALAVVVGAWVTWRAWKWLTRTLVRRWGWERRRAEIACMAVLVAIGLVLVLTLVITPIGGSVLGLRPDRLEVWRNSLDLAGDYAFTGMGLSGFEMAYSSYMVLLHVPYLFHAHDLFLDIHLQQGLLGLAVFVWWVLTSVWKSKHDSGWTTAARASLAVILIHGLTDDPFYGYGGYGTPLLFVPLAMLARRTGQGIERIPDKRQTTRRIRPALAAPAMGALALLVVGFVPEVRSTLEANLGAIAQTRAELSVYHWPEWSFQDQLRRQKTVDLSGAMGWYKASLASNPANATANRRLGQIELSMGEYDAAREHLLRANASAPGQRATRQLLGESYAIAGEIEKATRLWRTVSTDAGQLQLRLWWYKDYLRDLERAAGVSLAAAGTRR